MESIGYNIKAVVQKTRLSAHVIRVWEKRYGAVTPSRSETNRRLYSEDDVERLNLLSCGVQGGHSIGTIAQLPTPMLRKLVRGISELEESTLAPTEKAKAQNSSMSRASVHGHTTPEQRIEESLQAIRLLDADPLHQSLDMLETELGRQGLLVRFVAPLAKRMGEAWENGEITAAHEHFATAILREHLLNGTRSYAESRQAPILVVSTPTGQLHELGAVMAAAGASTKGWAPKYLGVSLPAAELAGAVRQSEAKALALSLVYPEDDPELDKEFLQLRRLLPPGLPILVGGRAVPHYETSLRRIHAEPFTSLEAFLKKLDELRGLNLSGLHQRWS